MKERLQKIGMTEIRNISPLDRLCEIVKEYYINNNVSSLTGVDWLEPLSILSEVTVEYL